MEAEEKRPNPNFRIEKAEWYILCIKKTIEFCNHKFVYALIIAILTALIKIFLTSVFKE